MLKSKRWGVHSAFLPIVWAVLLYLIIPVSDHYISGSEDPGHLQVAFEKELQLLEPVLRSETENLSAGFDTIAQGHLPESFFNQVKKDRPPDIVSFVFKNDSVVFWSSNREIFTSGQPGNLKNGFQALHLQNGWYVCFCSSVGTWKFLSATLIKNEYPVRNMYLDNRYSSRFNLPESASISSDKKGRPVFTSTGTYLFSLVFDPVNKPDNAMFGGSVKATSLISVLYLLLFLASSGFLIWFLYRMLGRLPDGLSKAVFVMVLVIFRGIQFWFQFPGQLYKTELFGPAWYSSSFFMPSMGDLLINALLILVITRLIHLSDRTFNIGLTRKKSRHYLLLPLLTGAFIGFIAFDFMVTDLVINSSFPLNFQNIANLTPGSVYGIFCLIFLSGGLFYFTEVLLKSAWNHDLPVKWLITMLLAVIVIITSIELVIGINMNYHVPVLFFIYISGNRYIHSGNQLTLSTQHVLLLVLFYAVYATFILNQANALKEKEKVKLLAIKLTTNRNPVTEDIYNQMFGELVADTNLHAMVFAGLQEEQVADSLDVYLKRSYFNDYWGRYNIQVTLCKPTNELRVQPQGYLIGCNQLFRDMIDNFGDSTATPGFWFLDYGYGREYYLATLHLSDSSSAVVKKASIYIEFTVNGAIPDPGYPSLLLDKDRSDQSELSEYSYALYLDDNLTHAVGDAYYKQNIRDYAHYVPEGSVFRDAGFNHFHFKLPHHSDLLISRNEDRFLTFITPFSYLFIFFALTGFFLTGVMLVNQRFQCDREPISLRLKLQLSLTGILVITMLIIGIVQIRYIADISEKKNRDGLREKAYSIQTEVQYKFNMESSADEVRGKEPENFLIKLSNVFFTDINLYDPTGFLISSSRPKIFREKFISERIHPVAYQEMIMKHSPVLIHEEAIGTMFFASVYLPMHNDRGQLLGYVNLPYFARQDVLKREISSFLVTFINIYILLFLFGVIISLLISNYITSPLALLAGKMSLLRLGKPNERIAWRNDDEIGLLVAQYNRMIDELERSAAQLARTERESAWRQMARQVAHEIKNPLTPMKLSAQFLQKSWNESAPDMDQRIHRFTTTLVEQIDTLAAIASDFSNFARMPQAQPVVLNLAELIHTVLAWYPQHAGIQYIFEPCDPNLVIKADQSQLTRVFTNLINNSIQAIGSRADGVVRIGLKAEAGRIVIEVADNGPGISAEMAPRMFQPDFTTKTGGMGLGLAIVKAIVNDMNGEISFISDETKGTTFTIIFPANTTE